MTSKDDKLNKELRALEALEFLNASAKFLLVLAVVLVIVLVTSNPATFIAVQGLILGIFFSLAASAIAAMIASVMKSEIKKRQTISGQTVSNTASSDNLWRKENNPSNSARNPEQMKIKLNNGTGALRAVDISREDTLTHATVVGGEIDNSVPVAEAEELPHATVVGGEIDNSVQVAVAEAEEELPHATVVSDPKVRRSTRS